jgi:hypothetical protein
VFLLDQDQRKGWAPPIERKGLLALKATFLPSPGAKARQGLNQGSILNTRFGCTAALNVVRLEYTHGISTENGPHTRNCHSCPRPLFHHRDMQHV